jgi:hypothetical protein
MEHELELRIRERAYAIWHAEGRPDGQAHAHWLMAEQELRRVGTFSPPKPATSRTKRRPSSQTRKAKSS